MSGDDLRIIVKNAIFLARIVGISDKAPHREEEVILHQGMVSLVAAELIRSACNNAEVRKALLELEF